MTQRYKITLEEKLKTSAIAAGIICFTGWFGYNIINGIYRSVTDAPEELIGFEEIINQGYELFSVDISTRGDVTKIIKLSEGQKEYDTNDLIFRNDEMIGQYQIINDTNQGILTIKGVFEYCIEPALKFAPQDANHSDFRGNTPFGEGGEAYWCDLRHGEITFKKNG